MGITAVPEKFIGKFKHDRSENFDEYLTSRGVPWLIRKMICYVSVTKIIEKSKVNEGAYNMYNQSVKENTAYENWVLGKSFEGKGLDGKQHRITFNMADADTLTEEHLRLENNNDTGEVYKYTVEGGNMLVLKLENESVVCKRFFKRVEEANPIRQRDQRAEQ